MSRYDMSYTATIKIVMNKQVYAETEEAALEVMNFYVQKGALDVEFKPKKDDFVEEYYVDYVKESIDFLEF